MTKNDIKLSQKLIGIGMNIEQTTDIYQILDVKKPAIACGLFYLAPSTGLEPVTYGLTVR